MVIKIGNPKLPIIVIHPGILVGSTNYHLLFVLMYKRRLKKEKYNPFCKFK